MYSMPHMHAPAHEVTHYGLIVHKTMLSCTYHSVEGFEGMHHVESMHVHNGCSSAQLIPVISKATTHENTLNTHTHTPMSISPCTLAWYTEHGHLPKYTKILHTIVHASMLYTIINFS